LHRFSEQLCSSFLQFGFKAKHSTSMCTMILKDVIAYYAAHGGSLYCTMLDATKAFDHVEYCKLLNGLLRRECRDIPGVYIRLLLNIHCVPKKWTTKLKVVTLSNLNRFSKFFHC